jgi:hypothetical protein
VWESKELLGRRCCGPWSSWHHGASGGRRGCGERRSGHVPVEMNCCLLASGADLLTQALQTFLQTVSEDENEMQSFGL